ncbi:hypothetical protein PLESTM_001340000 [Pleodorina starrii]|nr:hypothetical protein PLESTM_001340000 [Pleodorina starrii]
MSLCSCLIVVGYALMEVRGLVAAPLPAAAVQTGADGVRGGADNDANPHHPALRLLSAWFLLTAGAALVQARRGNYRAHRRWALRHIASGAWVILQRLFVLGIAAWASAAGVAFSEARRRELFFAAASAAVVTSVATAELYLWLAAERSSPMAAAATPPRHPSRGKTSTKTD